MAKEKEKSAPEEELLVLHEKWVKAAREHLKEIVIGAVVLILVAAIWSGIRYYFQNKENKASLLYAHAIMSKDRAKQEEVLRQVIKKYAGTTSALEARLSLYEIYLEKKDYQKALEELEHLRKKAKEPWRAFLDLGV
jgi:predicted negative regulator of RcsB-dependent stress response